MVEKSRNIEKFLAVRGINSGKANKEVVLHTNGIFFG
jgi:hypothetical protein